MTDLQSARKMPYSVLSEQALLGSLLIDPASLMKISDKIKSTDFYLQEHQQIYSAILTLSGASHEIDIVTLLDTLEREKVYGDRSGAEAYLKTLIDSVPTALNIDDYARIVAEKSIMRRLIEACDSISTRAFSEQEKTDEVLKYAADQINEISMGRDSRAFQRLNDLIVNVYSDLEILSKNSEAFAGINTGFHEVDRYLTGIGNTDLVIVGARPGMGKTALCLNIAVNVAKYVGCKVAIFSLEMSGEQLASRILSSQAKVDSKSMRTGKLDDGDWPKLAHAVDELNNTQILIDDTSNITVSGIKAKVRRENQIGDKKIGLIVLDYLQLMNGEKHTDNRVLEIGDITRNLKLMAKELQVPVICCSQLSRGVESRQTANKRPMISDLRESGSIEQDADSIMFIYRDEYYRNEGNKKEDEPEVPVAEIIIAKNRHGSTGTAKLNWLGQYTLFYEPPANGLSEEDAPD